VPDAPLDAADAEAEADRDDRRAELKKGHPELPEFGGLGNCMELLSSCSTPSKRLVKKHINTNVNYSQLLLSHIESITSL
jgi:hypothetical protein